MSEGTRFEVDGEVFLVHQDPATLGSIRCDWVSGPNAGYGFASQTSDRSPYSDGAITASIRSFLAQVDRRTGFIE